MVLPEILTLKAKPWDHLVNRDLITMVIMDAIRRPTAWAKSFKDDRFEYLWPVNNLWDEIHVDVHDKFREIPDRYGDELVITHIWNAVENKNDGILDTVYDVVAALAVFPNAGKYLRFTEEELIERLIKNDPVAILIRKGIVALWDKTVYEDDEDDFRVLTHHPMDDVY